MGKHSIVIKNVSFIDTIKYFSDCNNLNRVFQKGSQLAVAETFIKIMFSCCQDL